MNCNRQGSRGRRYPLFAALSLLASFANADSWNTADPLRLGLNVASIESFRELCEDTGADACLVAYRGTIVLEWYGPSYREPIYTMSSVKSWTALLIGMLIADGAIPGVETSVSSYLPEWAAGATAGVSVRQLLSMTSGLDSRSGESGPRRGIGFVLDKNTFVFGLPLDHRPGSRWAYSNEGVQLLSPLIERASGVSPATYAQSRLFRPLGMMNTRLHEYPAGQVWTYADAETTLRDFARIGQLILDEGRAGNTLVIEPEWIRSCLTPQPLNPRYGLLWWIHYRQDKPGPRRFFRSLIQRVLGQRRPRSSPYAYSTQGYLNTDCYVIPEDGIVAARMQMRPQLSQGRAYDREEALSYLDTISDNTP